MAFKFTEMEEKKDIRKRISQMRRCPGMLPSDDCAVDFWERVEADSDFISARTILLYSSLPDEIPTGLFIERCSRTKRIVLPVVCGDTLVLREYDPERLQSGYCGILEPSSECPEVDPGEIDFAVIPGVAFDRECRRLGRGRGYYDRLLPDLSCPTVSVAMPYQIVDCVPSDPWDVRIGRIYVFDEF